MLFKIKTEYNQKALSAMAKGLRKTVRKKHSRRSHILGWIVAVLGLLLSLPSGDHFDLSFKTIITWVAVAVIIVAMLREDAINGSFARKRMLPQLLTSTVEFTENGYHSVTEVGNSDFRYDTIVALAETDRYFVFIFSKSHAQVYDKTGFEIGTAEDFRTFIQEITALKLQRI